MNPEHWWLLLFWAGFSALHSLLATGWWKGLMAGMLGSGARYFRLVYSIIAFISLSLVLAYQYSINSPLLWESTILMNILGALVLIPGALIMAQSIKKYFFYLSGIDVLVKVKDNPGLQVDGLHKMVRHPLYLGTLLVVWGLFLLFPFLHNLIACLSITVYTLIGIRFEEKKLVEEFGEQYKRYAESVPMLLPRIRREQKV